MAVIGRSVEVSVKLTDSVTMAGVRVSMKERLIDSGAVRVGLVDGRSEGLRTPESVRVRALVLLAVRTVRVGA